MSVLLIIEIFVPSGKTFVSSASFFMFVPYFPEIPDIFINKVIFATKVARPRSNTKLSSRKYLKICEAQSGLYLYREKKLHRFNSSSYVTGLNRSKRGSVRSTLRVAMATNLALFSWDSFHQCLFLFTLNKSFEKLFLVITLKHHLC